MKCVRCKGTGKVICSSCGGSGEAPNENHYLADTSWEYRYVICRECFGIGKKTCPICNGTGNMSDSATS